MKGFAPIVFGIFVMLALSWAGLAFVPNLQIGHLDPQTDEDGTDIYPMPPSGMATRGRQVYVANGCAYCHSQQVRADYAGSDIDRKWGSRRSVPRDYIFAQPVELGEIRLGPDLANIGARAPAEEEPAAPTSSPAANTTAPAASPPAVPLTAESATPPRYSAAWHHQHLYAPRSLNVDSIMPSYRFLYRRQKLEGQPAVDAVKLTGADAPPAGFEIVPTYEAKCLVAYLLSLNQSHPLKEVKSVAAAAASPSPEPPKK